MNVEKNVNFMIREEIFNVVHHNICEIKYIKDTLFL